MASNVGDVHVEIESCRLDFYKRVSNARFMGKKTKKQARLEKRPFTSEKGKNPEKASEKRKNPGKKKKQDQRLASNQSGSRCGSCAAATWVAHGPVSRCGPRSRAVVR